MKALLGVEIRRYLSRRLVRMFAALALLGIVTGGTILFVRSHRLGTGEAQVLAKRAQEAWANDLQACARGDFGISPGDVPPGQTLAEFCERSVVGPPVAGDPRFHLIRLYDVALATSGQLIVLFLILGASFIGAEWHAGTMATLLTWETRRGRVLLAKVCAAALVAFTGLLIAETVLALVLLPSALFHGVTQGADAAWLRSVAGIVLRGATVAALASGLGCALASIGRNTAAALGASFAYVAVIEPILRGWKPKWQPWLLYDNVATFVQGHGADFTVVARSMVGSGIVVAAYAAALVAVAGALFARRDVG